MLWPKYSQPQDLADVEALPLSRRDLPESTYHLVLRAAELWPDRLAVSAIPDAEHWTESISLSYRELASQVTSFANALTGSGVGRGDAVAIISPNCAELPSATLAAEAAGIVAPINPALSVGYVKDLLARSQARVMIAAGPALSSDVWEKACKIAIDGGIHTLLALSPTGSGDHQPLEPLSGVRVGYLADLAGREHSSRLAAPLPGFGDCAAYFHTGGTTCAPKLAAHTHANEVSDA